MSYIYKIQQNADIIELELKGELNIEKIDEVKSILFDFINSGEVLEMKNSKIESIDLTFLQLLVALKKDAIIGGKKLTIRDDFNPDVSNYINLSGLREFIF